ncbi:MAG TPA: HDOD domain-containing protein [Variovorax sp.]|nr:HDOD domain-containing protein [Variovorax sp.]
MAHPLQMQPPGPATPAALATALRRIMVDAQGRVAAYRLSPARSRGGETTIAAFTASPDDDGDDDEGESIGFAKPTFLRCTCAELALGDFTGLDPATTVFDVRESAGMASPSLLQERAVLESVHGQGFRLAFDAKLLQTTHEAFMPLTSFVILDMTALEVDRAAAVARALKRRQQVATVAIQVRTPAVFDALADAGVALYEGLWFAEPRRQESPAPVSYAGLLELMNKVAQDADVAEIEALLQLQPTTSYELLRHINTAGFGRRTEVSSFRHAVMTIGTARLLRWTALLLARTRVGDVAPAASTLAVVRGRLMELMVRDSLPPAEADLAFIAGMFSMLDVLLQVPLEQAIGLLNLPDAVTDTVLRDRGPLARYLQIARACETNDRAALAILAERFGIPVAQAMRAHGNALAWAERLDR